MDTSGSDTAATLTSVTGSGDERDAGATISAARPVHPYVHVVIVAVIGAVAVFAWLWFFETVNRLLWENDFVTANRWMFPVICLPFSLLVGLLVKYRHAPTNLDESMLDSLSGDVSKIDWRSLPVTVVMALVSLFSGAVLGPEGGIGGIASKIAALYNEKVQIPAEHRSQLVFSTLASAYNGLIANPLFTGVLGSELVKDADTRARTLPANLIGGSIGYLIFFAAGSSGLENYLHLSPTQPFSPSDVVLVVVFGLIGLILAILAGALFRVASAVFGRFQGREVERALAAGVVFSIVGIVAPIVLFSGETQIQTVVADPSAYGPGLLVVMAIVKLALLAVAFKSGFLGGPTFPAIFASVCVALALSLLLPGIRIDVLIGGVMAGFLIVLFKAPFMVILLTVVMLQAGAELTALIVLAVAAVMIVQPYILAAIAGRQAARAARRAEARR
ncbi:MAG TPA: chloride channel protein [Patescibacteria group bacterium]|nr:chloride channel protein [Patescibacteria group bacterium]